jgi:hypothetical protein
MEILMDGIARGDVICLTMIHPVVYVKDMEEYPLVTEMIKSS